MQTPSLRVLALALLLAACARSSEPEPAPDTAAASRASGLAGTLEHPSSLLLEWDQGPSLAGARAWFTLTPLLDGRLLAAGGTGPGRDTVVASAEVYDPATGAWSATAPLATARHGHTATRLPDGRVLVVGGAGGIFNVNPRNLLTSAEVYDPATGTWSPTGSLAEARTKHTATLLPDGRVLVTGGLMLVPGNPEQRIASAEVYDPATGTWSSTAPLAEARAWHTATLLPEGRVLVVGGSGRYGDQTALAELYDPASGTWTSTRPLHSHHSRHTATLLKDGRVLISGWESGTRWTSELYDPASGTWTKTGSHALMRNEATATLLPDGRVLIAGGADPHSNDARACEIYDPATGTWSFTGGLSVIRHGHAATLLPDGSVLVVGGKGRFLDDPHYPSTEVLVPAPGTWKATAPPAQARSGHTATLLPSGKVLVTGGRGASGELASAELYDSVTGAWSTTGTLTQARSGHTATLLGNGRVLVVGQGAELYDAATRTWSATGAPARARSGHTATLLEDGRVLVTGGEDAEGALAGAELYDPDTGTWSATGSLSRARSGHTATLLRDGRVLVVGQGAELYDPATGTWSETPSSPRAHSGHTATLLPSGAVLVTGGEASPHAELYDPARGTWSRAAPLPEARQEHTATLLPSGAVLVVGGRDGSGPVAGAVLHLRATGTWTSAGRLTHHRGNHTATLLPSGKVLVAGGSFLGYHSSTELYDPATGAWSAGASMSVPRSGHTATLLPDGKVLVTGGLSSTVSGPVYTYHPPFSVASAELYDPATGTWTRTGSMARARHHHTAVLLHSGQVLVMGGHNDAEFISAPELYNPATGTWTPVRPANLRTLDTAVVLRDGRVLALQDGSFGDSASMRAELYDPDTGTWTPTGAPSIGRHWHKLLPLPSGKVLMTGGRDSRWDSLTSTELYDPATGTWTPTGPLTQAAREYFTTATLLPTGKVLITGGRPGAGTELYDPATGAWTAQRPTRQKRNNHAAALLTDGRVLIMNGYGGTEGLKLAEVYEDTAASAGWRPVLTRPAAGELLEAGSALQVEGALLRGLSEASGGNSRSSPTGFPVLTLLDLARDTLYSVPLRDFSPTHATATVPRVPSGQYLLSVIVNGVSAGRVVLIQGVLPLDTTLTSTRTSGRSATFTFTANEEGAGFECSLDGADFAACTSPVTSAPLAVGPHTFRVRALGAEGAVDPTPATHEWTVPQNSNPSADASVDGDTPPTPGVTEAVAPGPPGGGCAAGPGEASWLLAALALLGGTARRRRAR
jgi:MYXO-CTERM domain-containing protein